MAMKFLRMSVNTNGKEKDLNFVFFFFFVSTLVCITAYNTNTQNASYRPVCNRSSYCNRNVGNQAIFFLLKMQLVYLKKSKL